MTNGIEPAWQEPGIAWGELNEYGIKSCTQHIKPFSCKRKRAQEEQRHIYNTPYKIYRFHHNRHYPWAAEKGAQGIHGDVWGKQRGTSYTSRPTPMCLVNDDVVALMSTCYVGKFDVQTNRETHS